MKSTVRKLQHVPPPTPPNPLGGGGGGQPTGASRGANMSELTVYKVRRTKHHPTTSGNSNGAPFPQRTKGMDATRFSPAAVMMSLMGALPYYTKGGNGGSTTGTTNSNPSIGGNGAFGGPSSSSSYHQSLANSYSAVAARSANAALFDAYRVAQHNEWEDRRVAQLVEDHEAAVRSLGLGGDGHGREKGVAVPLPPTPPAHLLHSAPPPLDLMRPAVHNCTFTQLGLKQVCPTCLFAQTGHDLPPDASLLDFAVAMRLLSALGATNVTNLLVDSFYIFSACDRPALHCSGQSFFSLDREDALVGCGKLLELLKGSQSNDDPFFFNADISSPQTSPQNTGAGGANLGVMGASVGAGTAGGPSLKGVAGVGGGSSGIAMSNGTGGASSPPSPQSGGVPPSVSTPAATVSVLSSLTAEEFVRTVTEISGPTDLVACVSLCPHLAGPILSRYLESEASIIKSNSTSTASSASSYPQNASNARDFLYSQITVFAILLHLPSVASLRASGGDMLDCLLQTVAIFPTPSQLREDLNTENNAHRNSSAVRRSKRAEDLLNEREAHDDRLLRVAQGFYEEVSTSVVNLLHSVSPDEQLRLFCEHKLNKEAPIAAGSEHDLWRSVAFYLYRKRRHEIVKIVSQRSLPYITEVIIPLILNVSRQGVVATSTSTAAASTSDSVPSDNGAPTVYSRAIPSSEVHAVLTDVGQGLLERAEVIDRQCAVSSSLSEDDVFDLVRSGTVLGLLCGYAVHGYKAGWGSGRGSGEQQQMGTTATNNAFRRGDYDDYDPDSYDSVVTRNQQKDFLTRVRELNIGVPRSLHDLVRIGEKIVELAFETPSIAMRWVLKHFNQMYTAVWDRVQAYTRQSRAELDAWERAQRSKTNSYTQKVDTGVVSDPMGTTSSDEATAANESMLEGGTLTNAQASSPPPHPSTQTEPSPTARRAAELWWADELVRAHTDSKIPPPKRQKLIDNPLPRKLLTEFAERLENIADSACECRAFAGAAPALRSIVRSISVTSSHEEIRQTALLFAVLGSTDQLKALIQKELNQNVMLPSASIAILHDLVRRCPPNTPSYQILMSALTDLLVPPSASRSRWDDYVVMRQLVRSEHSKGRLDEATHRALLRWTSTNATKSMFFSLVSARMVILALLFAGYYSGNSLEGGLVRKRLKKRFKREFSEAVDDEQSKHMATSAASATSTESSSPAAALFTPLPSTILPLAKGETVFATPEAAHKLLSFAANDVAALAAAGKGGVLEVKRRFITGWPIPVTSLGSSSCPFRTQVSMTLYSPSPIDLIRDMAMSFRESLPPFWTGIFFLYPIYSPSVQRYLVRNVCDGEETVVVLRMARGTAPLTHASVEAIRKYCGNKCAIVFVGDRTSFSEVAGGVVGVDESSLSSASAETNSFSSVSQPPLATGVDSRSSTATTTSRLVAVGEGPASIRARCVFDFCPPSRPSSPPPLDSTIHTMPKKEPTSLTASPLANSDADNQSPHQPLPLPPTEAEKSSEGFQVSSTTKGSLKNAPLSALKAVRRARDELRLVIAYVCLLMGYAFTQVGQCLNDNFPSSIANGVKVVRTISKVPIRPDVERVLLMSPRGVGGGNSTLGGGAKLNAAFPLPVELCCERLL